MWLKAPEEAKQVALELRVFNYDSKREESRRFRSSSVTLYSRKLWKFLKELAHHFTDLKGQFSGGSDDQSANLHKQTNKQTFKASTLSVQEI